MVLTLLQFKQDLDVIELPVHQILSSIARAFVMMEEPPVGNYERIDCHYERIDGP